MDRVRRDRAVWDAFGSIGDVLPEVTEEPWWRRRFLSASVRWSVLFEWLGHQYQRWMAVGIVVAVGCSAAAIGAIGAASPHRVDVLTVVVSITVLLAVGVPVAAVAANTILRVKAYAVGFVVSYSAALLVSAWRGRPGLVVPLVEPAEAAALPFALTLVAAIMAIGALTTAAIQLATVAMYRSVIRAVARDLPAVRLLRVAADLTELAASPPQRRPRLPVAEARVVHRLAGVVEKWVVPPLGRGDSFGYLLDERASLAASHLRVLSLRLLAATPEQQAEIALALRRIALCLLLGLYDRLGELGESSAALLAAATRRRGSRFWTVWTVVTVLPAATVASVHLSRIAVPGGVLQWFTAFAIVWLVVRVIAALEPNYRPAVDAAMDLVNATRG